MSGYKKKEVVGRLNTRKDPASQHRHNLMATLSRPLGDNPTGDKSIPLRTLAAQAEARGRLIAHNKSAATAQMRRDKTLPDYRDCVQW